MDFNLVTNIEICQAFKSEAPLNLIYYSHIPTAAVTLFMGIFVFLKNKKSLVSKILFGISLSFSLWLASDLLIWEFGYNSAITMFSWSILSIFNVLFFVFSLYFVYVFADRKDVGFIPKIVIFIIILPVILLAPTKWSVTNFDSTICEAVETKFIVNYYLILEIVIAAWIIIASFVKYKKAVSDFRKQILFLAIGVSIFLLSYFSAQYVAYKTGDYKIEQYGFFGMTIFMFFLAYLIVKYKAFNIKLLGAQALVLALVALVGSQFFFISFDNTINLILISVTVLLAVIFGIFLIDSVKKEVQRKEELQYMSDQLAKANDQLKKLDNAKSDFISIASHQLRTPLTSIKGFISLLLEGSYGKTTALQQETLNKVYQSNERLINLVEDLLNISRIESGRMEFNFAPCQLAGLCQEVVDGLAIRAKNSKLYLNYKKPAELLPEIMIDGGKVREVLSNMVDNALKYTPKGGVAVKLEQKETNLRVTVSDTGIGIPATELPYLFSKFSRGKDTSRLNTGGTGLGLYVGKAMIEQNGGKIWAESDGEGQGSRFIIELPVEQSKEILAQWGK